MKEITHFIIIEESDGFHYIFADIENNILLKSISYANKVDCQQALLLVKEFGSHDDNYIRMMTPDEKYYFILRNDRLRELASAHIVASATERNKLIDECIRYFKSRAFNP